MSADTAETTSHASAKILVRHAIARGIPAATASGWLGVSAAALDRPGRLPIGRVLDAWVTLRNELADSSVAAHAISHWSLADQDLFGFYIAAAPTLRDALDAGARFIRLATDRGAWQLVEDGERVRCVWSWNGPNTLDHALSNEVIVSGFAKGIHELSGAPPLRVEFTHRAPPERGEHEAVLSCDVRFGRPQTAIVLERARMSAATRSANPALYRFLGELAGRTLAELGAPTVQARAARLLARRLREDAELPALPELARNLGMSERTLRRKLAEEEVSFRELRCTAQLERAAELLADTDASLTQIALAAGFADASAFGRAWRRSHGAPPSRSRIARG
jgi:AraC-like DNA-binding protein